MNSSISPHTRSKSLQCSPFGLHFQKKSLTDFSGTRRASALRPAPRSCPPVPGVYRKSQQDSGQ